VARRPEERAGAGRPPRPNSRPREASEKQLSGCGRSPGLTSVLGRGFVDFCPFLQVLALALSYFSFRGANKSCIWI